jgi:hypothetical protein
MGSLQASEMAKYAPSLETAIEWHLRSNHYPPHPFFMIPVALRAIKKFNRGKWNTKIRLPEDAEHRRYGKLVPVPVVLESLHLWEFVDDTAYLHYQEGWKL